MNELIPYIERYALRSLEKRDKLMRLVGDHSLDLDAGTARFGRAASIPFQVLGTESENTLTWLWAWADEQSELPDRLLRASREMKVWLERMGLGAFALPSVDLDTADGLTLSLIAAEVCSANAFYRDPYEGGAVFVLLSGGDIDRQPGFDRTALVRCLADLDARYDLNLRTALGAYVRSRRLIFDEREDLMNVLLENGQRLIIEFNANGKIRTVNGEPSRTPTGR